MNNSVYYVEHLNLNVFCVHVCPLILADIMRNRAASRRIYYVEGSRAGIWMASRILGRVGIPVERLDFRVDDLKDRSGTSILLRLIFHDLADVESSILRRSPVRDILESLGDRNRLALYLRKRITLVDPFTPTLWRALYLIRVTAGHRDREHGGATGVLFLSRMLWLAELESYARQHGMNVVAVKNYFKELRIETSHVWNGFRASISDRRRIGFDTVVPPATPSKLAVEHHGLLNLNYPERLSDLPFWHQGRIPGKHMLLIFHPWEPLDEAKWTELSEHGISAIALHPRATRIPSVPVYPPDTRRPTVNFPNAMSRGPACAAECRWLRRQASYFEAGAEYWERIIRRNRIKVYLSWQKYDAAHCIKAEGMNRTGGVMAIYQRAFEERPSPAAATAADVVLSFAQGSAKLYRHTRSMVSYHVAIGYLTDYRFDLLRRQAAEIARQIRQNGAEYIVAYFDENSHDDARWHAGHEHMRENYLFLLERVLNEPWLGLVLKPKVPRSLRRRLGDVQKVLQEAEKTGRCFVVEGGAVQSSYPPALAALAADVAVHGHLHGATAGFESALAGVPTLILDREGWPDHSLYRLGRGRVVFTEWDELWNVCKEHRGRRKSMNGFGDWSALLHEMDPFRDGRSAERMAAYLKWLLDGFDAGLPKNAVLADAAERYGKEWGYDKVSAAGPDER